MTNSDMKQAQVYQQQIQTLMAQKENLNLQLTELKKALDELGKVKKGDEVYRMSGPILIKSTKSETKKDLKKKRKLIEKRLEDIKDSEKLIAGKMNKIRKKIKKTEKSSESDVKVGG